MDPIVSQLILSAATSGVGILVGWVMGGIKGAAKERVEAREESERAREMDREVAAKDREVTKEILKTLLYCRLSDMNRRYVVDKVKCTPADLQEAEEVYRMYHDILGGNGSGTTLYQEIMGAHAS